MKKQATQPSQSSRLAKREAIWSMASDQKDETKQVDPKSSLPAKAVAAENDPVLSPEEVGLLTKYEAIIERGKKTFVEVGLALCSIKDKRLYRQTHTNFQSYCVQRWGFSRI